MPQQGSPLSPDNTKEDLTMARILVIDDNTTLRMMIRETLERAGHEVVEACNGQEG